MSDFYNKYPYTDFHELNLDWIIERVKQLTEDWLETKQAWEGTEADWQELYNYVHDYFDNLNVQQEINNKLDEMVADGTFEEIAQPIIDTQIASTVSAWLAEHITPTTPVVDDTLSISEAAADSATVGDLTFHYIMPGSGAEFEHDFTTTGAAATVIRVTAGETYTFRNITDPNEEKSTGAVYVAGYPDDAITIPDTYGATASGSFTHSGQLAYYNTKNATCTIKFRLMGLADDIPEIESDADLITFDALNIQSDTDKKPVIRLTGKTINSAGNIVDSTNNSVTDFIPVLPGVIVSSFTPGWTGRINSCEFYTKDKQKIGGYNQYEPSIMGIVAPANAYYMRVSIITAYYDDVIIRVNPETLAVNDATTLRIVLDRFKNTLTDRKYTVLLKNGTYDIASTFTADEINNAEYSTDGWCGLEVGNNITLKGESRDGVILNCEIDPDTYSSTQRGQISTLNLKGNCNLENLTITSKYIRYPVHDDFAQSANCTHKIINCSMIAGVNNSNTKTNGYGLGSRSGETILIDNCYIAPYMIYHNNVGFTVSSVVTINNSEIKERLELWDFNCPVSCYLHVNNVKGNYIMHSFNGTHDQTIMIDGVGQCPDFMVCDASVRYNLGNCTEKEIHWGGAAGQPVSDYYGSNRLKFGSANVTNVPIQMIGILLEDTNNDKLGIVQTSGYVSANKLGLTDTSSWSVGTMLKFGGSDDSYLLIPTLTASEAQAYVAVIIDSVPYIKLLL